MRNSSRLMLGTYLPSRSITLTGKVTSVVFTRTTSSSATSCGAFASVERVRVVWSFEVCVPVSTGGLVLRVVGAVVGAVLGCVVLVWPTRRGRDCARAESAAQQSRERSNTGTTNFLIADSSLVARTANGSAGLTRQL